MNIFFTNSDPILCAEDHNKTHLIKMILEYAQLLSTAHRVLDGNPVKTTSKSGRVKTIYVLDDPFMDYQLYAATHINHPSAKWVRTSSEHYKWLLQCLNELCAIYEHYSGKKHKTSNILLQLCNLPNNIPDTPWQDPFVAINKEQYPDAHLESTVQQKYRTYMMLKLNEWLARGRKVEWYTQQPHWLMLNR